MLFGSKKDIEALSTKSTTMQIIKRKTDEYNDFNDLYYTDWSVEMENLDVEGLIDQLLSEVKHWDNWNTDTWALEDVRKSLTDAINQAIKTGKLVKVIHNDAEILIDNRGSKLSIDINVRACEFGMI